VIAADRGVSGGESCVDHALLAIVMVKPELAALLPKCPIRRKVARNCVFGFFVSCCFVFSVPVVVSKVVVVVSKDRLEHEWPLDRPGGGSGTVALHSHTSHTSHFIEPSKLPTEPETSRRVQ